MAITTPELRKKLSELIDAGDQKALEEFAIENFADFPQETQGDILLGFIAEALEKKEGEEKLLDLQEQGIELVDKLTELKDSLPSAASEEETDQ